MDKLKGAGSQNAGGPPRLGERVKVEIIGIALLVLGVFVLLSLMSFSSSDPSFNSSGTGAPSNYIGVFGAYTADLFVQSLGWASYLVAFAMLVYAVRFMALRPVKYPGWVATGYGVLTLAAAGLASQYYGDVAFDRDNFSAGGVIGELLSKGLTALFNDAGSYLLLGAVLLCAVMFTVNFSLFSFGDNIRARIMRVLFALRERLILWRERRAKETEKRREQALAKKVRKKPAPKIVNTDKAVDKKKQGVQEAFEFVREKDGYHLPPDEVFEKGVEGETGPDEESLQLKARMLVKKLNDFGVEGEVVTVHPGPVVTMFEFKPAPGVTISRIVNRGDDLALALRALSIRIVAPIPGKDTVGVEIPNVDRQIVTLGEVLDSNQARASKAKLMLGLGKDISGDPVVADLAKMPHLLIAGATGSGKSVAVHSMLASLLQRATPKELKLLIIDPKMLELSVYDNIPHLLWPVVTDAKQAAKVLRWAVVEMERRYRLMAEEEGVRDIITFNKKMEKAKARGASEARTEGTPEPLPYVVIIIDELADLMMVSAKEVEDSIARLAQKARAAGIHLILATQRPSVDVITGMIKANFPARIAFQVAQRVDSRTILDAMGAETLLGNGDMLYLPPGTARLMRVHGSYVSEDEISKLVKFLRSQGKPDYDDSIMEEAQESGFDDDPEFDELYDQSVQYVAECRQASVSMIQRKFKIGYNRAARIIDTMEREGVVGPSRGAKPREVLVGDHS